MRHDGPQTPSPLHAPVADPRPTALSRLPARVWPLALIVVVAATSLALKVYASAWLVAPYLALMALVVGVPNPFRRGRTRRTGAKARRDRVRIGGRSVGSGLRWIRAFALARRADSRSVADPRPKAPAGFDADSGPPASSDAGGLDPESDPDDALSPGSPSARARRGRGKGRKSKPGVVAAPAGDDPAGGATWVRIGPGKFVRADSLSPTPPPPIAADGSAVGDGPAGDGTGDRAGPDPEPPGLDRSPVDDAPTVAEPVDSLVAPVLPGPADDASEGAGPDAPEAANAAEAVVEPPAPAEVASATAVGTGPPGPRDGTGTDVDGGGMDVPGSDDPRVPERAEAEAASRAPASAGTQKSVEAREWSEAVESDPAVEPGSGDAEDAVREDGFGVLGFGPGVEDVDAPGVTGDAWSGDNGIAPDASVDARPSAPPLGGPTHPDLEAAPGPTFPDPADAEPVARVEPVGPDFQPPEATPALEPTLEVPADCVGVGETRLTPDAPPARPVVRGRLVSSMRGGIPRPGRPAAIAAGRFGAGPGPPRRGRPVRLLGSRRGPRRVRNASRFRKADRCHPPRSPPESPRRGRTSHDGTTPGACLGLEPSRRGDAPVALPDPRPVGGGTVHAPTTLTIS